MLFASGSSLRKLERSSHDDAVAQVVMSAFTAGHYQAALTASEELRHKGNDTGDSCFYRGMALLHLGRSDEAVPSFKNSIRLYDDPSKSALSRQGLGEALLELGLFDDARRGFESSILEAPKRSACHRGVAESWLRQGAQPEAALRRANLAVQKEREIGPASRGHKDNLAAGLATLAWAVAINDGDAYKVHEIAAEAANLVHGVTCVPVSAQVHFHLGCAFATIADADRGAELFHLAANLDPKGHWGSAATRQAQLLAV